MLSWLLNFQDVYTNKYQGANINLSDAIDEYVDDLVNLEGDLQQGILGRKEKSQNKHTRNGQLRGSGTTH